MKTVSAREANQGFSKLLADAAAGRETLITRRGKPVARLVPVEAKKLDEERKAAIEDLKKLFAEGVNIGLGGVRISKDEMHER